MNDLTARAANARGGNDKSSAWPRNTVPAQTARRKQARLLRARRPAPPGYKSVPAALKAIRQTVEARKGRQKELVGYLNVHKKVVYVWLRAIRWPVDTRLAEMLYWRKQILRRDGE